MLVMSDPIAVSRRLVAVFAADVEGYSRLMSADEVGTLKGLTERRAIGEHRGRIANTAGDSVLAEFASAVDAVQCAVQAQAALWRGFCPVDARRHALWTGFGRGGFTRSNNQQLRNCASRVPCREKSK